MSWHMYDHYQLSDMSCCSDRGCSDKKTTDEAQLKATIEKLAESIKEKGLLQIIIWLNSAKFSKLLIKFAHLGTIGTVKLSGLIVFSYLNYVYD